MILDDWAKRWSIPDGALQELKNYFGINERHIKIRDTINESSVQSIVRLEASKKGCRLWRNNLGAVTTDDGRFIRYGLANESSQLNQQIKSADLIGIRPVLITPQLVGCTIGQFMSREIKKSTWEYTATEREKAQLRWAELILSFGGDACFAVGEGTI